MQAVARGRRARRTSLAIAGTVVVEKIGRQRRAERLAKLFGAAPHFALALELVKAGLTDKDAVKAGLSEEARTAMTAARERPMIFF